MDFWMVSVPYPLWLLMCALSGFGAYYLVYFMWWHR